MQRFHLTADHVDLLRHANIDTDYDAGHGSPRICPKRPFGNSDVGRDIARILGWRLFEDEHGEFHMDKEQGRKARRLFAELGTALQVVLSTGSFDPGLYVAEDCKRNWRMAPERILP